MDKTKDAHLIDKPALSQIKVAAEVNRARKTGQPIVALESAVITHGLPWPTNLHLAHDLEETVRGNGAVPATIAVLDGQIRVGLSGSQLSDLAEARDSRKVSLRDLGAVVAQKGTGGTTVAATMFLAEKTGVKVFATGGIGGVHRNAPFDISADLQQLGRCPVMVVCSGAKSILDLPATLEYLETQGVPVIGYQTNAFPAFYALDSGLKVEIRADSPEEAVAIAEAHWKLGLSSGILVVVPPPVEETLPFEKMEEFIQEALKQAETGGIHGSALTPFLLSKVNELSGGESTRANLALLRNNARVSALIAAKMTVKPAVSHYL